MDFPYWSQFRMRVIGRCGEGSSFEIKYFFVYVFKDGIGQIEDLTWKLMFVFVFFFLFFFLFLSFVKWGENGRSREKAPDHSQAELALSHM